MITGSHAIIYADDAEKARAFFRDVLDLPFVDVHGGWLIFKLPPAELGIHPTGGEQDQGAGPGNGHHELYLICDDVEATVAELSARGVEFDWTNRGAGLRPAHPSQDSRRGRHRPLPAKAPDRIRPLIGPSQRCLRPSTDRLATFA